MLKKDNGVSKIASQEKRDWLINIIIGIRKQVLIELRALGESFDREKYTKVQRDAINQEIREIAELVSEKDSEIKRLEILKNCEYDNKIKEGSLIDVVRKKVVTLLNKMRVNVLAVEYDGEYSIIDRELKEIEDMVKNKDRLVRSKVQYYYRGGTRNPYISRYFKIDDKPEIE